MSKVEGIIFDWAGTTVDYGCFAPVQAFLEAFEQYGIHLTKQEVREPMGMLKMDHIRAIMNMDRVRKCWNEVYGKDPDEQNVQEIYQIFEPKLLQILDRYAQPKPYVLETVKKKNEPIFSANRKKLEDKKYIGKSYRRKYRMQDILEIEKDISLLYSDDESIFDSPEVRRKNVHLSVEEQAEVKLFLEDYHGVLETLSPIQKNILNLWFDEDGIHSMSAKEISFVLGVSPKKVYREKEKAIKILQKSKVLQGYREM